MQYKYPHAAANRTPPDSGIRWAKNEYEYIHLLIEQDKAIEVIKTLREIYRAAYNDGIMDEKKRKGTAQSVDKSYAQGYDDCRVELISHMLNMHHSKKG